MRIVVVRLMEVVQGVRLNTMQLSIQVNVLIAAVQLEADVLEVLQNHILLGLYKKFIFEWLILDINFLEFFLCYQLFL